MSKLYSRKLWVTVATFVAAMLLEFFNVEVDPEVIVSVAGVVIAYLGGQSWVDRQQVEQEARLFLEAARSQALAQFQRATNGGPTATTTNEGFTHSDGAGA